VAASNVKGGLRAFANNIISLIEVSLLLDNRSNREEDFAEAAAATILGTAREVAGEERESCLALFLGKHPCLSSFTRSPNSAVFRVDVEATYVVTRFQ